MLTRNQLFLSFLEKYVILIFSVTYKRQALGINRNDLLSLFEIIIIVFKFKKGIANN